MDVLWGRPLAQGGREGGPACFAFDAESAPAWLAQLGLPRSLQWANFVCVNAVLAVIAACCAMCGPRRPLPVGFVAPPPARPSGLDRLVHACAVLALCAKVAFAVLGHKLMFMLNPCHVLNVMVVLAAPRRSAGSTRLTVLLLPWITGAIMALVTPDPERQFSWEPAHFWYQHLVIVLAPVYLVARDGSAVDNPAGVLGKVARDPVTLVRATLLYLVYSTLLLIPISRLTGVNTNYMLCPPAPLESFGAAYLVVWTTAALPICTLLAWLVVEAGRGLLLLVPSLRPLGLSTSADKTA
jgi:uncharacterized membrane protein YwaF